LLSNSEEIADIENRTDKTDEKQEAADSPSSDELTELTEPLPGGSSPILVAAARARPSDVNDANWATAMRGLSAFLRDGHGAEAERLGWPPDELYRVPELWSQIHLTGCALLIGDREVIDITADKIEIKTASGATLAFRRKPEVDYRLVYETRLKLIRGNYHSDSEEPGLRAFDYAVNFCRQHAGVSLEEAKALVRAAIAKAAAP
jgi:hypothetical protein